ncbi:RdgB/HAM1 family non-canonical purine NTP pyrophosphatase [Alphaproteobacteria bacterium]|nr:RdgB/HAM1 family non-canonical purine NTP pyrophosphatase [Alphaproteobacteria bacterium]
MKELLFFSHNQNKIIEINKIFKSNKIKIQNLNFFQKIKDIAETGKSFSENAKIKSKYGQKIFKMPCFADDSGFCIEALNKKPGVKSKRFLERFSSNKDAFNHIISSVIKKNNDKAFFITAISLSLKTNHHITFLGKINGRVSLKPLGNNGFGYDPIFIPENYEKTFAEMSQDEKNKISHRKLAITKLKSFLF